MSSLDVWLVGFGLRSAALLAGELAVFVYVVPTLFNRHSDLADLGAALLALAALVAGFLGVAMLGREAQALFDSSSSDK